MFKKKVDFEKFLCSFIKENKRLSTSMGSDTKLLEKYKDGIEIMDIIDVALQEQGFEYKDGKIRRMKKKPTASLLDSLEVRRMAVFPEVDLMKHAKDTPDDGDIPMVIIG